MFISFASQAKIYNYSTYNYRTYTDSISEILELPEDIIITLVPMREQMEYYYAGLTQEISQTEYVIHLNSYLGGNDPLKVLIHELIHVDDLVKDVLILLNETNEYIYKGEKYNFEGHAEEYEKLVEADTRAKTDSIYYLLEEHLPK
jgi:hypothetical protein